MKIQSSKKLGFTLVEIMIVVAIIGMLMAIAVPNFFKARNTAQKNACITNLHQIDGVKQMWALENHKRNGAEVTSTDLRPYLGRNSGGGWPQCPGGGTYTVNPIGEDPTCDVPEHVLPQE